MRRNSTVFALVWALSVLVLSCSTLFAIEKCDNQDFHGTYGILGSGAVTAPGYPITGPFGRAGRVVANGRGDVSFFTTASYNGLLFDEAIAGTYQVFPDCRIEFKLQPFAPVGVPATFEGVVADNNREVQFMIADPPGQTIHATLRRQSQQHCSAENLSGGYALDLSGTFDLVAFQTTPPLQFVRTGQFVADGKGSFTTGTFVNYNGLQIMKENIAGTYAVDPNCAVTLQYQDASGQTQQWKGALTDNSKRAYLIVNEPGSVIIGTLKQQ
jgi:hypothetical protein